MQDLMRFGIEGDIGDIFPVMLVEKITDFIHAPPWHEKLYILLGTLSPVFPK
jgi:hypothetical protein